MAGWENIRTAGRVSPGRGDVYPSPHSVVTGNVIPIFLDMTIFCA
jgi:hypothetical protein